MSALSHKRTFLHLRSMSALSPKPDIAPRQLGRLSTRFKIQVLASRCNEHLARPHPKLRSGSTDCLTTILQTTTAYPTDWACVLPLIPPQSAQGGRLRPALRLLLPCGRPSCSWKSQRN